MNRRKDDATPNRSLSGDRFNRFGTVGGVNPHILSRGKETIMQVGREAHIILDASLTRHVRLIELEALAGKAAALLCCKAGAVSATIFRKPESPESRVTSDEPRASYWISLGGPERPLMEMYELRPQAPVVDFEVVSHPVSDLVTTG
jgi:hypothetical protein